MIYAEQSQPFEASYESGITGLFGTVSVQVVDNQGVVVIAPSTGSIIESPAGTGVYEATRTAPAAVGQYTVVWSVDGTYAAAGVSIDDLLVYVAGANPNLPPLPPPSQTGGPTQGPCSAWTTTDEVEACGDREFVPAELDALEVSITQASEILFRLSARQFSGSCDATARPCSTRNWCGVQILSRGHIVSWDNGWWGEDGSLCGCRPLSQVKLAGYPVREIVTVKIDGDTVDPDLYRLDGYRFLTRVDGWWPACQTLDLPDTDAGTFSVRYLYGVDPPMTGKGAAAELAYQLFLLCNTDNDCVLPRGVTRITRQGVTVDKLAFTSWSFREGRWMTGLPMVDAFLSSTNPAGIQRRPVFWAPGRRQYAQPWG